MANLTDEQKQALETFEERIAALENSGIPESSVENLGSRIARLEANALPPDDQKKMAYQHAGEWLRMVNTITWTLSSIFLVGAIIALNGAVQVQKEPELWRSRIGWSVVALCVIWALIDIMYEWSASDARRKLEVIEQEWRPENKFYTPQVAGCSGCRRGIVIVLIAAPIVGLGCVALFLFALQ